jgi:hypothetical protein
LNVPATDERYEQLTVSGQRSTHGIYDPTVVYEPSGEVGWLAYSTVTGDFKPVGPYVNTEIARSDDHGRTWRYVRGINQAYDDTLTFIDGSRLSGVWRYEVPTLVHDAHDPDRAWKLLTHKYFWNAERDRMVAYGWISMKHAAQPGAEWSDEIALLGTGTWLDAGLAPGTGAFPPPPYGPVRTQINSLSPDLSGYLVYTEPGAFEHDGALYLSLTAIKREGHDAIVMLRSEDHAQSWKFVAKLATSEDARALGYLYFDGTSIAADRGRVFLLASPAAALENHAGTMVFEFADLAAGLLARDASGRLAPRMHLLPQRAFLSERGGGQGDYDEHNTYGGLLFAQVNIPAYPEVFQIFNTKRMLAPVDGAS